MSRATELAKECGAKSVVMTSQQIEAFYHAARAEALREAANLCDHEHGTAGDAGAKIRAMADREGK